MTNRPPTLSEMENALAHYGVKGMRWGIRRPDGGGSSSSGGNKSGGGGLDSARAMLRSKAVSTAKTAYGVNSQLKAIDKRLALPSLAFAAGVAVAGVTGVGLPAVAGLSIGHKVFSDPTVQAALKSAASYSKAIVKEVGSTKLPDMKMPNMPKVKNPFSVSSTQRFPGRGPIKNPVKVDVNGQTIIVPQSQLGDFIKVKEM